MSPSPRKKQASSPTETVEAKLRKAGLSWPEVTEHFPWGHRTLKVHGKAFVFMGGDAGTWTLSLKLPDSGLAALDLPFAAPTRYGLGKSGWVTATFAAREKPPAPLLLAWLRESYEAVAPRRLLSGSSSSGSSSSGPASAVGKGKPKVSRKAPAKPRARAKLKPMPKPEAKPKPKPAAARRATTVRVARPKAKSAGRARTVAGVRNSG